MTENNSESEKTSVIRIILSWIIVGIPLVWGITMTVIKAMALFR